MKTFNTNPEPQKIYDSKQSARDFFREDCTEMHKAVKNGKLFDKHHKDTFWDFTCLSLQLVTFPSPGIC